MKIIDAEGMILGRLASKIAKELLENEKAGMDEDIQVVNAEKAVVVGRKDAILERFRFMRDVGSIRKGPFYPRMPDRVLKRTVRGMIPYQKPQGRNAFRRLKAHIGIPLEFKDTERTVYEDVRHRKGAALSLNDISRYLGAKVRWE